jgi:lysophospholipase L1-like esterase
MSVKTIQIIILFIVLLSCKMKDDANDIKPSVTPAPVVQPVSVKPVPASPVRYLALGDSYTKGESVSPDQSYPVQLCAALSASGVPVSSYKIIAQTGWTTASLQAAIQAAGLQDTFNMVSLLIGVNNQYQNRSLAEYRTDFLELAEQAIQFAGGHKEYVFVISIPDYGYTPFGSSNQASISAQIDQFNAVNKYLSDSLDLRYYDITPISRKGLDEPDLVASDGLHPSGKMYGEWVKLIMQSR